VDLETGLPLSIALVIDDSESMARKRGLDVLIKDLARRMLTPSDRLLLTTFNSRVDVYPDFVGNAAPVMEKLDNLTRSGGTQLYDGIHNAIESWLKREDDSKRRRVVLLVSDGRDSASQRKEADVIAVAREEGIAVYAVSTNQISATGKVIERNGDNHLQSLANNTGGRAYFPREAKLSGAFLQLIEDELRSRYIVYYEPTSASAKLPQLEIRVHAVEGLQYSTRIQELRFFKH
jgi:VWFA-related protein